MTRERSGSVVARSAGLPQRIDPGERLRTPGFRAESPAEVPHKVQPGFYGAVQSLKNRLQIAGINSGAMHLVL